jgi:hypothetical protein
VIESGGEERRVIFGRLLTGGGLADSHPRMLV